jgi:hypothetical protein
MTVPPFGGGSTRGDRWLNALKRRWLTQAGNQLALPVTATNTTLAVVFLNPENTIHYGVIAVPNWNTTVWVTAKTATGCTLNFGTAAPGSAVVDVATFRSEAT